MYDLMGLLSIQIREDNNQKLNCQFAGVLISLDTGYVDRWNNESKMSYSGSSMLLKNCLDVRCTLTDFEI
jgi:hypothetical protein